MIENSWVSCCVFGIVDFYILDNVFEFFGDDNIVKV